MLLRSIFSILIGLGCAGLWIAPQVAHAQNKYTGLTEKVDYTVLAPTNVVVVLENLQKQTGYSFTFERPALSGIVLPTVHLRQATLGTALQFLEEHAGLSFLISGRNIAVAPNAGFKKKAVGTPAGQNVSLAGRIVDFETSEPLTNATLLLSGAGTSKTVTSDEKGYYGFKEMQPGKYILLTTHAGYQRNRTDNVVITAGRETVIDIKMQAEGSLQEVVVRSTDHRVRAVTHTTEKDLVAQIRNATGVVSGISNEMITKTGDRNAAEVVKRISGVTVMDDRFIVVRGMNERYNLTYLNNNVAPTTELYSKAFAYDLLPSSIIDRIIVYKSPVADLVADYGGGAIKVYTKNAMPVRHLDIGVQIAHRPGSTMTNVNSYTGGRYDFLGFDDGSRKLPSWSPGYFQTEKRTTGVSQTDMVKALSSTLDYGSMCSLPDMQIFLNYYNTWNLGGTKRLFDLTSVTYTHETKSYALYRQSGNTNSYGVDSNGTNTGSQNRISHVRQTTENGKINILENLTLRLNKNHTLEFKNFIVNEGRKLTSLTDTRPNEIPRLDSSDGYPRKKDILLSFQQRLLYSGNFGGVHSWGAAHVQELGWNLGYTYDLQHVPDQRASHFLSVFGDPFTATGSNTTKYDDAFLGMISRLFIKTEENVYNASVDYTLHLNDNWQFKAGSYQMFRLRTVGRRFFRVNRGGLPGDIGGGTFTTLSNFGWANGFGLSNPTLVNFPLQQLSTIWNPANFPEDNTGLALYDATSPTDSYVASEQNNAFYVMGDWKAAREKITINAGLRVEYDRQKSASAIPAIFPGAISLSYANHPLTSWLPSVNISYRPSETLVFRTGYGRTVNRPEFREISSYIDFDFQNIEGIAGNPAIVTAVLDNFDLRAEWYPRSALQNELFNAGVFYKNIQHPIERLRAENANDGDVSNFTGITFGNALSAKVIGVEAEIRKTLSFLGGARLFKNLSVAANGAWIKSSTMQVLTSTGGSSTAIDTARGRPLQGQSPYIVNTGLFYENAGWGTKLGLVYNVSGPRIYAKSLLNFNFKMQNIGPKDTLQYRPDLLQLPFHQLDLSITQRIFRSLQMKFTLQNILDQESRIVEDHNYNQKYDPEKPIYIPAYHAAYYQGDNIYSRFKPGRYFLVQFTYAF